MWSSEGEYDLCGKGEVIVEDLGGRGCELTGSTGYEVGIMKRSRAGRAIAPARVISAVNFAQGSW